MHKYLKKIIDERNGLAGLMQTLADKAAAEDRDLTDAESERMRGWQERAAHLDAEAAEHSEYIETQRSWARLQDRLAANSAEDDETPVLSGVSTRGADAGSASWGELFVRSAEFKNYSGVGSSAKADLPGVFETRAPIDTTFFPNLPPHTYAPPQWTMTTPLLDAISRERTSNGAVQWIKYPPGYPLAGVVAEGALKPEANFAPTVENAALQTYAHHKAITRQALEDLPRIQSIVENYLRQGILAKIEADAVAELEADTDIGSVENDDLLTGIRIAIGNVQAAGYTAANLIALNPADFAALDVGIWENGNAAAPSINSGFWGIRTVAVPAIDAGTAYVGDFKAGMVLFDRAQTAVYMTDSHADNFLRNILVILAEARALPVVAEPAALQKVVPTPVVP